MAQQNVQRADALVAGSRLHTYIIIKVLGSGAFGITDSASQGTTETPAPEATEPSQSGTGEAQSSETTDSSN